MYLGTTKLESKINNRLYHSKRSNNIKIEDVRVLRGIEYHSDQFRSDTLDILDLKFSCLYRYSVRNCEEERGQNIEKIKNIKYRIENLMQDSIKYLYQKRLNENEAVNIFGNILESIPGAAKKALGNQERRKNSK